MHVLHIEDGRENRLLVRKLLEARGHRVTDAVDGLTGIELALSEDPDLLLVDINIPGLNGYEVVTRLKGEPAMANTPVVAITAEGDRDRALALGFDGFIVKPIRMATFGHQIEAFRDGRREILPEGERTGHLIDQNRRVVTRLEVKVRELTQANARLREVDALKMAVLRNVSHELHTPMTPLMGYVKMLFGGELGPVNSQQGTVLRRMAGSLERLGGIIDNLLNVTRFASGGVCLETAVVDPSKIAREVADGMQSAVRERRMRLDLRIGRLERIVADRGRLVEALRQIVGNAIKFGPDGQIIQLAVHVLRGPDGDTRMVEWAVSDAGPGIAVEQRDRVIEAFYQIDDSITRTHGGTGLGLAIAERIADLHGGRLLISNATGGGARVAIRVPVRPNAPMPE
ncbi:MAG: signal transduction histidine kinase [Bradymonadia bacterium]